MRSKWQKPYRFLFSVGPRASHPSSKIPPVPPGDIHKMRFSCAHSPVAEIFLVSSTACMFIPFLSLYLSSAVHSAQTTSVSQLALQALQDQEFSQSLCCTEYSVLVALANKFPKAKGYCKFLESCVNSELGLQSFASASIIHFAKYARFHGQDTQRFVNCLLLLFYPLLSSTGFTFKPEKFIYSSMLPNPVNFIEKRVSLRFLPNTRQFPSLTP